MTICLAGLVEDRYFLALENVRLLISVAVLRVGGLGTVFFSGMHLELS